jgi:hypothetical protein
MHLFCNVEIPLLAIPQQETTEMLRMTRGNKLIMLYHKMKHTTTME